MRRLWRFVLVVLAGAILAIASVALLAPQVGIVLDANQVSAAETIDLDPLAQRSAVLAADGSLLTYLLVDENRISVPLADVSPVFVDTLLAVEDERFYEHDGINFRATARALLENVNAGDTQQGGSTITQQLVKNALLTPEQTLERKVQEAVLARRLEAQMTKDEILERYLNTVYLGNSTYGVQAAAELYFGRPAADLDVAQSSMLVGMIQEPNQLEPFANPQASRGRRDEVVDRLLRVGLIDEPVARIVKATALPSEGFAFSVRPKDYFVEEVKDQLLDDVRLGETPQDRYNTLYRGGLTIRTTVEPRLQQLADEAVAEVLPDTLGRFTASIVSVDPRSGAVRAMVGGPGFGEAQYNIATQGAGRQTGSSFKPFVLATVLEQGHSIQDTINGRGPCTFPNPGSDPDIYDVENFDSARGGTADLREQTIRSSNCAYVRLGILAGPQKVVETANRLGVTTPLAPVLSASLGTNDIRPIDMASAYGTFANDGVHFTPYYVEEVLSRDGEVLIEGRTTGAQVLDPGIARTVTSVLADNVRSGTGTRAKFPDGRDAAGKTGTTSDYADAWFVGYTPELSTAVWMGSPRGNEDKMTDVGGIRVTGGSYPARMWQAYMGPALQPYEMLTFAEPPPAEDGTSLTIPGEEEDVRSGSSSSRSSTTRRSSGSGTARRSTPATTAPTQATATTAPATEVTTAPPADPAPPATAAPDAGGGNGNGGGNDGGGNTPGQPPPADGATG